MDKSLQAIQQVLTMASRLKKQKTTKLAVGPASEADEKIPKRSWREWLTPTSLWIVLPIVVAVTAVLTNWLNTPSRKLHFIQSEGMFRLPRDIGVDAKEGSPLEIPSWMKQIAAVDQIVVGNYGTDALTTIRIATPGAQFAEVWRASGMTSAATPNELIIDSLQPREAITVFVWSNTGTANYIVTHDKGVASYSTKASRLANASVSTETLIIAAIVGGTVLGVFLFLVSEVARLSRLTSTIEPAKVNSDVTRRAA